MIKALTGRDNDFLRIVMPACAAGKLPAVKSYVEDPRGFVHRIGPHGRTMLWEAAQKGRLPVVKYLDREHDADPRAIGCYYRETRIEVSPWLVATVNGHVDTADYLASRDAGLDFHSACYLGDADFVNEVLKHNPAAADRAYQRDHQWNGYLVYPLQYAIVGQQLDMVERLLDHGTNAAAHPQILFDAIDTGQAKIAELLLAHGTDPKATRHRGWLEDPTFNLLARRYGHDIREVDVPPQQWPEIVDAARGNHNAPDDPARVARLIRRGQDVNVRDYKGKTALHRASQAGFAKITELLLDHGADIEARSHDGETPLFDAAFHGRTRHLELLVARGANVEARNLREETPLFAAVRGGQADAVRKFTELGASLDAVNNKGQTVGDVASRSSKIGIESVRKVLRDCNRQGSNSLIRKKK